MTGQMVYLDDGPAAGGMGGAHKYHGNVATGYDAKRDESPKWRAEQEIIEGWLSAYPEGTKVIDCPVGTGRFIPYCEGKGFKYLGIDVSTDMLDQAAQKITKRDGSIVLAQGSVLQLPIKPKSVDVAMMIRLTRWLTPEECVRALQELQRVATKAVIFTARVRNHPHARGYDLIRSALDGWHITGDEPADGEDYRVIMLEPAS